MVFVLFIVSRFLLFLCAFVAQKTIPYLGFFPYKELLVEYHLSSWISSFANFDGIHYLLIAKQGYSQWEQAFFPLFPLLIRMCAFIIPNYLIAALFVSHASFVVGLFVFQKLLKRWGIKTIAPLLFLLVFPTSFFFAAIYTESLFFLLFVLSLYFLHKKQYWLAGAFAALTSFTRLIGIFLVIPFFFFLLAENRGKLAYVKFQILKFKFLLLSPFIGLFSYMSYLWVSTGDPLFFFNSQPVFGAHRSTHFIFLPQVYYRYLKIILTTTHNFQWYLSFFEMSIFSVVLAVLLLDFVKIIRQLSHPTTKTYALLGINIFSLINLLLPTFTGTFSSIPRYVLFSFSFFLYLAGLKSKGIKIGIFVICITLQIILLSLFIQGYFVG